jgi:hypothetical protein
MKTAFNLSLAILITTLASSCIDLDFGDYLETHTIVHEDGSIERKIIIESRDSADMKTNAFGIGTKSGWLVAMKVRVDTIKRDTATVHSVRYIEFTKSFQTIDEANKEMAEVADTLIAIKASVETKFRWLYTDFEYSDTYTSKLSKTVSFDDYFSQEEFEMIRLDEHYRKRNPQDSSKMKAIEEKIDEYFQRSMFEGTFANTLKTLERKNVDDNWIDSVRNKKDDFFKLLEKSDFDQSNIPSILSDSLRIPVTFDKNDSRSFEKMEKTQTDFLLSLYNLNVHSIEVPYDLIGTNADSTEGRVVFWKKPGQLVLLKDVAMTASYRQLNYWAIALVVLAGLALIFLLFRRLI